MKKITIYGLHAVESLLQKQPQRVSQLWVASERQDQRMRVLLALAKAADIPIEMVTREKLDRLSQSATHQGVIALCSPAQQYTENDLLTLLDTVVTPPFFLILDGVTDPHNLGACLRTADAAGVTAVIAPKDRAAGLSETAIKVASGAAETVPFIQVTNLARTLTLLKEKGVWLYGAAGEAEKSLYAETFTGPVALVLGAEGSGLRRLTRELCDGLLKIPLQGSVSSLNVSVAAGVCLFEVVRQRILSVK